MAVYPGVVVSDYKPGFRLDWACELCCVCPILFTCLFCILSRNDLYISSIFHPLVKCSTVQYAMGQDKFMGSQDTLAKYALYIMISQVYTWKVPLTS